MAVLDGKHIDPDSIPANRIKDPAAILSTQLAQRTEQRIQIPFSAWRVWDAIASNLPGTGAADDLALNSGTFATASPTIQTGDLKAAGSTDRYARCLIALPFNYDDAETVILRAHAGMKTTISDGTAVIDFQVYESDLSEGISADICATAQQTINSLTLGNKDFVITATSLTKGDVLDIRMKINVTDTSTGTAVIGMVGNVELLLDTQ